MHNDCVKGKIDSILKMTKEEFSDLCGNPTVVIFPPGVLKALGIEITKDNMDGVRLFETKDKRRGRKAIDS